MLKVSCTWEDVHHMLSDSPKVHSSHAIQIRRKLLQASVALQVFTINRILVSSVESFVGSFSWISSSAIYLGPQSPIFLLQNPEKFDFLFYEDLVKF